MEGDRSVFRVLVERYKDVSLTLACALIKNREEAEDVLQDAFMKAFKNLHKFNFQSSFSTWLYRIVSNTCYTALERKKSHKTSSMEQQTAHLQAEGSSFDQLREEERRAYIQQVLGSMKPKEALVLKLHYLGEQSISEISAITDLSTANVKVVLHRARKSFQADLEELLGQEKNYLL